MSDACESGSLCDDAGKRTCWPDTGRGLTCSSHTVSVGQCMRSYKVVEVTDSRKSRLISNKIKIQSWPKKLDHFSKFITPVCDNIEMRFMRGVETI